MSTTDFNQLTWDPLVQQAFNRFRKILDVHYDVLDVVRQGTLCGSDFVQSISNLITRAQSKSSSILRLSPILKSLDDMSATAVLAFGVDTTTTKLLWGSLYILIELASSEKEILQPVLEMLEDIATRIPRLLRYEETMQIVGQLKLILLDLYTEITCFCARSIEFMRHHPHVRLRRHAWMKLKQDFSGTMLTINRIANKVESEIESSQVRITQDLQKRVLASIQPATLDQSHVRPSTLNCNMTSPQAHIIHGRQRELARLRECLIKKKSDNSPSIAVLYGMGGVGKTEIARKFAQISQPDFDVILWISCISEAEFQQSFKVCAKKILAGKYDQSTPGDPISETMEWVQRPNTRCLLIFDDVEDHLLLRRAWPTRSSPSILLTCRGLSTAHAFCAKVFEVISFDEESSIDFLLKYTASSKQDKDAAMAARELSDLFGGLPLALSHLTSHCNKEGMSLTTYLRLCNQRERPINSKQRMEVDNRHILEKVWGRSFSGLSEDATILLGMLCFFQPDSIEIALLQECPSDQRDTLIIADEERFGDAEETLLESSLIRKDMDDGSLSMHRLVQTTALKRLSREEKSRYAMLVLQLLLFGSALTDSGNVESQHSSSDRARHIANHAKHLCRIIQEPRNEILISNYSEYDKLLSLAADK